jgi:hypothetical protein
MLHLYQNTLLDLFGRVQLINADPDGSHAECLAVQETLLRKITYAERKITRLKRRCRELKAKLRNPDPALRLNREQAAIIKEEISTAKFICDEYRRLTIVFREIGDCLAFTYLDKYNIKPMAFKEPPGFVSGKKGTRLERRCLRRAFAGGYLAILNDLTNCLRYGDLTIPVGGMPKLIELKSGKSSGEREDRQIEKMSRLSEYLTTDRVTDWYHPGVMTRLAFEQEEVNHRNQLNELIAIALQSHSSYRQVEDGLHYLVVAPPPGVEPDFHALSDIAPSFRNPPVAVIVNQLKQNNVAYFPFPLSITNPQHTLKFYNGDFLIMIFLDTDFVLSYLQHNGISAQFVDDAEWKLTLRNDSPSDGELHEAKVSEHFMSRLFAEFLSLSWLLDVIIQHVKRPNMQLLVGSDTAIPPVSPA